MNVPPTSESRIRPGTWNKGQRVERKQAILNRAFAQGVIGPGTTATAFMDFDGLAETVNRLRHAFPSCWRHRFAVKANPLVAVLRELSAFGLEMEAASAGEIAVCKVAGVPKTKISFNSPVKTEQEIRDALAGGLPLSIDNVQEFERIARLRAGEDARTFPPAGFRINPQVGAGEIALTSTAHRSSKFGYPIEEIGARERLVALYRDHPWLTFLHVHTGSQGVPLERMVESIVLVQDLARDINRAACRQSIAAINIGGGLPIHCDPDYDNVSFEEYAGALRVAAPDLFSGEFEVETEFGRSIAAENGFVIARVEYTKTAGGRHVAATHAGAQLAARTALAPEDWPLSVTVLNPSGLPKQGPLVPTDLAGPCCFGGDLLCRERMLVQIEPGDFILLHNMGAYSFTAHYDFNLIPRINVYSAEGNSEDVSLTCIRSQQNMKTICNLLS